MTAHLKMAPVDQDNDATPAAGPPAHEMSNLTHEQALEALKTTYAQRTAKFYALRDAISREGSGPCPEQAYRFFAFLRDEYEEARYLLEVEADSFRTSMEKQLDEVKRRLSKIKADKDKTQKEYQKLILEKDDLTFMRDNHEPSKKCFSVKVQELPTFSGDRNAEKVITFLSGLQRVFQRRNRELNLLGSTEGWGDYAVGQLRGPAANWGQLEWPINTDVDWDRFQKRLREHFVPHGTLEELHCLMASLKVSSGQSVREFNDAFLQLRLRIRIIAGLVTDDNLDSNIINSYITKLKTAALIESPSKPRIKPVWAMYTSWRYQPDNQNAPLRDIMHYCQLMDGALNDKTTTTTTTSIANGHTTNNGANTTTPANATDAVADNGDPMDLSQLQLFKMGIKWAESKERANRENKFEKADVNNDWKKKVRCWYCEKVGHLKKECRKRRVDKKKEKEANLVETEADTNDESDSSDSGKE